MNDADDERVDCLAVVEEMYTFLDGELTERRRVQISQHLDGCVDCHEVVDFHAELKITISAKCREQVPARLQQRILDAMGLPGRLGPGITGV